MARRLLIIEDEPSIVEGISALMEKHGISVEAINSGVEARQTIARFHPDVVLLDHGLPVMDGSQVYAEIRKANPAIGIIFATWHGNRQVLHDGLRDPRTRFLQKPFEVADLLEMMVDLEKAKRP